MGLNVLLHGHIMDADHLFGPHAALAQTLLSNACGADDGAHDLSHVMRVWENVRRIQREEGGDLRTLVAATLLHDCVEVAKDSPLRAVASRLAAEKADELLSALAWSRDEISAVWHAIETHSFSAGKAPMSLEAKILQDADRLDALGHIGIARCFYVSGRLGRMIYDPEDPPASTRPLDDDDYALDHFQTKLLRLADGFQTATGARLANQRHDVVQRFLDGLLAEVSGG